MRRRAGTRGGFTLVELIVGMTVATLIVGAAAGVFVTTLRSWERGSRHQRLLQVARTTSDLLEKHLRAALAPGNDQNVFFMGEDLSAGDNYGHRLMFFSAAESRLPRSQPPTDQALVEFTFDPLEDKVLSLRVNADPEADADPEEGGHRVTLSDAVESFEVLYFDGTEWVEEWTSRELPQAVEFHITIVDGAAGMDERQAPDVFEVSRLVAMPLAKTQ